LNKAFFALFILGCLVLSGSLPTSAAQDSLAERVRVELLQARQLTPPISSKVDPVIDQIWQSFDRQSAMTLVSFMSERWRLAGNSGYDESIDRVRATLLASGFSDRREPGKPSLWIEQSQGQGRGWDYTVGTLSIIGNGQPDRVVLSKEKERLALCINSFSTKAGGIVVPLVDVGRGDRPQDYEKKNVKGSVVLGDADAGRLWRVAMERGAIGIISTSLANYVNPVSPSAVAPPRDEWDILQWSSIPYDEEHKGFGFKATPRAASTLRKALASGPVQLRVEIASSFSNKPERTLVAEIPGRTAPDERVVIAAHVQEPGANDNASGVATLQEMARALANAIASGKIARPERTITMLWLNEISGSRQWLQQHADQKQGVRYMFSMDMTGEDVTKTGGSFLVERWPDPGAVWESAWDPHSEWGKGNVKKETLAGDLINDLHLAICERVAGKAKWIVHSNPYEGGSDHTVFGSAGVPSVLNWHFTDRFYHTNMDTADKTSGDEMRNVATAVTASTWLMASADEALALEVGSLVQRAGKARIAIEVRQQSKAEVVDAWRKWYREAVLSATRLVPGPVSTRLATQLKEISNQF